MSNKLEHNLLVLQELTTPKSEEIAGLSLCMTRGGLALIDINIMHKLNIKIRFGGNIMYLINITINATLAKGQIAYDCLTATRGPAISV